MALIDIHTHKNYSNSNIIAVNNVFAGDSYEHKMFCSVGVHPWHIGHYNYNSAMQSIETALLQKNVIAVGETGIDRVIDTPVKMQIDWFTGQCLLAQKYNKPLILHVVKAYADVIGVVKYNKITVPVIIHGFRGNAVTAAQLINAGFYLSFGKALLQSQQLEQVFTMLPVNNMFFETDDSDVLIESLYIKAKQLLPNTNFEQVMINNFKNAFNIIV